MAASAEDHGQHQRGDVETNGGAPSITAVVLAARTHARSIRLSCASTLLHGRERVALSSSTRRSAWRLVR